MMLFFKLHTIQKGSCRETCSVRRPPLYADRPGSVGVKHHHGLEPVYQFGECFIPDLLLFAG